MISEGSCDTEDWSNDAENSVCIITGINYILKYIKAEKLLFKIVIKYHNITVFTEFLISWMHNWWT